MCVSAPITSVSGASCSFQICLHMALACLHVLHVAIGPSSVSSMPSNALLLIILQIVSRAMCASHLCSVVRSTHSGLSAAMYTCSTLYSPVMLTGMFPMCLLFLSWILQHSWSNSTVYLAFVTTTY